jgi:hypothetical protein
MKCAIGRIIGLCWHIGIGRGFYYVLELEDFMNYALLYCLSDADTMYEAVIDVRGYLAECLVNTDVRDETVPLGISKSKIPGDLTFYSARASSGGVFNRRPYQDLDAFLDEFRSILGHDLYRIARFEQRQKDSIENEIQIDSDRERMMSLAEDLMFRVNSMDVGEDSSLLGKILTELSFRTIPNKNLIFAVKSHLYSMVLEDEDLGFSEYLRYDGPWVVKNVNYFNSWSTGFYPEVYGFDCTGAYPEAVSLNKLSRMDDGFVVEVETKY